MYYKCHKVNFKRGGQCFDSPNWVKKKKVTKNPKIEDSKCFQYAATIASNFEEIESHTKRISNTKLFVNKYNWERINCLSNLDDWKMFDKNNPTIALSEGIQAFSHGRGKGA